MVLSNFRKVFKSSRSTSSLKIINIRYDNIIYLELCKYLLQIFNSVVFSVNVW